MHFLKKGQKIWARVDPPSSFEQCSKKNAFLRKKVADSYEEAENGKTTIPCVKCV